MPVPRLWLSNPGGLVCCFTLLRPLAKTRLPRKFGVGKLRVEWASLAVHLDLVLGLDIVADALRPHVQSDG